MNEKQEATASTSFEAATSIVFPEAPPAPIEENTCRSDPPSESPAASMEEYPLAPPDYVWGSHPQVEAAILTLRMFDPRVRIHICRLVED